MYREIIVPRSQKYILNIPKEYIDQEIEILVLPFSYHKNKKKEIRNIDPMIILQTSSMEKTWNNSEDEAWNDL